MAKYGGRRILILAFLAAMGCGGRTLEDDNGKSAIPGDGTNPDAPLPTCGDICRRAVDMCFPGASIDQCSRDCDKMLSDYKGCSGLDAFLRCRAKSRIVCTDQVVFDGCSAELDAVVRCHS